MSEARRYLIVNADDFGLTDGINRGIIEAHEYGIVTSASLMVRHPAASRAAELARMHPELSLGLHFDIAEWRFQNGQWQAFYQVVDSHDAAAVEAELKRQLATFEKMIGRPPTHLDSHQHVHKSEPAQKVMLNASEEFGVPLRAHDREINYCGEFYGQTAEGEPYPSGILPSRLIEIINQLKPGWTEIGCHPGYATDLDSVYSSEREEELRVVSHRDVRDVLDSKRIRLSSFRDYLTLRDAE